MLKGFVRPNHGLAPYYGLLRNRNCILKKTFTYNLIKEKFYSSRNDNSDTLKADLKRNNNIKSLLKEVKTIPNMITLSRIISTPLITYSLIHQDYTTSISLFSYAAISDFLDGFIARRFKMNTRLGSILDPLADKILILSTICGLYQVIPTYVFSLFLLKDSLLIGKSFISFLENKKNNFITQQNINLLQVKPTYISKANTAFQLFYIGGLFVFLVYKKENNDEDCDAKKKEKIEHLDSFFEYFGIFVSTTTVLSGLSYLGPRFIRRYLK
ncbi:uncharacterized protein HGUI_00849 [Hanseniaspora guilliermondii]|uniref:Cardiolipin synthase n=1 Tax=Hanseniaspora guilliermondii TaxID=56406 RepID=A0A1L0CJW7_9ASCO|nr:uncharacterized protein HGUI_00849 [Hanseniaspora guilliermondii]